MFYWVKTPGFVRKLFPGYLWSLPNSDKKIYLTFDDGPHPEITPWVLEELKKYAAQATFFCVGDNVKKYPETFDKVLEEGHSIGNHTFNHLNNWKTDQRTYIENTLIASKCFEEQRSSTKLFRPPHGKMRRKTARKLKELGFRIVLWDVLSGDFDQGISEKKCLEHVLKNTESGSIIVFHDSEKSLQKLRFVLPKALQALHNKGFSFEKLPQD